MDYNEVLHNENSSKSAMKDKMDSHADNQTWELIELPAGKRRCTKVGVWG